MFLPLGLGVVARVQDRAEQYVAWSWAVNGFFSVIGSVLTTILSMALGFGLVQLGALIVYAVAVPVLAFLRLKRVLVAHAATEDAPTPVSTPVEPSGKPVAV